MLCKALSLALLLTICILNVTAFNFDLKYPVVKQLDQRDTYFGYSIAQHYNKDTKTHYLLVGAPKANYKSQNRTGAIYRCPIGATTTKNDCTLVDINFSMPNTDEGSSTYKDQNIKEQFKGQITENQWLGVSVASTGSGLFSACAHKYIHYYNFLDDDEHASYGSCYLFDNNFRQTMKFIPCLSYTHKVSMFSYNYAYCQAGTSLVLAEADGLVNSQKTRTFISMGMPTALNFRGLVNVKESGDEFIDYLYKNRSQMCAFNTLNGQPVDNFHCSRMWNPHSYLGMSSAFIGNYLEKGETQHLIATGAPRDTLFGTVRLFTMKFDSADGASMKLINKTLKGIHRGAYFGFSIAAVDVNGDGLKDLVVGAPFYSEKRSTNQGAIYVFMHGKTTGIQTEFVFNFTGKAHSQFGTTIASCGDIDNDGTEDFVVGAPYETNLSSNVSSGAVYVFRGSKDGRVKLSQKISANVFENKVGAIVGFGSALNGGTDMDANGWPDIAVGAFKSDAVFVLRTYPTVNVTASIRNLKDLQSINVLSCAKNNDKCFKVELCFELMPSDKNPNLKLPPLNYTLIADASFGANSRVYFWDDVNKKNVSGSMELSFGTTVPKCEEHYLRFKSEIDDRLTPMLFNLSFEFDRNDTEKENDWVDVNQFPLAHEDTNKRSFELNFKKDCGNDNRCDSDLSFKNVKISDMHMSDDGVYLISASESKTLVVSGRLENNGDMSYSTEIEVNFDDRLEFSNVEGLMPFGLACKQVRNSWLCKADNGQPIASNAKIDFRFKFEANRLFQSTQEKNVKISLKCRTASNDIDLSNNNVELNGRLVIKANIKLTATNTPEQVFYDINVRGESAMKKFEDIGPLIEHNYKIFNFGPFSLNDFNMRILWPYETSPSDIYSDSSPNPNGKYMLYLTQSPTKIPNNHPINVECTDTFAVDKLQLYKPSPQFNKKRDVGDVRQDTNEANINCFSHTAKCYEINCQFSGALKEGQSISLKFIARLWNSTLTEDYPKFSKVSISSHAKIFLNDAVMEDGSTNTETSATTVAHSKVTFKGEEQIPMWFFILFILIGVFIASVLIIVLGVCGCFTSKKYNEADELNEGELLHPLKKFTK